MIGVPVLISLLSATSFPASSVPRKPCSGANTFLTSIPLLSNASSKCTCPSSITEVWFTTRATRLSFSKRVTTSILSAPNFKEEPFGGIPGPPIVYNGKHRMKTNQDITFIFYTSLTGNKSSKCRYDSLNLHLLN